MSVAYVYLPLSPDLPIPTRNNCLPKTSPGSLVKFEYFPAQNVDMIRFKCVQVSIMVSTYSYHANFGKIFIHSLTNLMLRTSQPF